MGIVRSRTTIALPPCIFERQSWAERARNFPASENSAARKKAGLSIRRHSLSGARDCWDRQVVVRWALVRMTARHSAPWIVAAAPVFAAAIVAGQRAEAQPAAAHSCSEPWRAARSQVRLKKQ